jgi:hypothetical protein
MPADVRWCLRCYAPAYELAPRAPLHARGQLVDTPRHVVPTSRTKASATTFGLGGRVAWTVVVGALTLGAFGQLLGGNVAMLPVLLFWAGVAVTVLRQVWTPVPVDDAAPPSAVRLRDVWRAGLEEDAPSGPPRTRAMWAWRGAVWTLAALAILAFAYGPVTLRAIALAATTIALLVAFLRGFLAR